MADGVSINTGTAVTIASDDVSGTQYQVIKLDVGGNGASSPFTGTITEVANLAGGTVTLSNPTGTTVTVDHGTVTLSNPTGTTIQFNNGTVDLVKAGTITRVEGGTITLSNPTGTTVTVDHGTVTLSNPTGTTVQFNNGTVDSVTTVSNLTNGSVRITVGTITVLPNTPGGTLGLVSSVTEVANLAKGTITRVEGGSIVVTAGTFTAEIGDITGGTIDLITSVTEVANLAKGTITRLEGGTLGVVSSVGSVPGIGTLTNIGSITNIGMLHGGTVVTTMGDLTGGTLDLLSSVTEVANLAKGTITELEGGTLDVVSSVTNIANLAKGTITRLEGGTLGVVSSVTDVANLAKGTITRLEGGTLGVVSMLSAGTVTRLEQGSINVTAGTVRLNPNPTIVSNSYGTTTNGTIGTLVAAPSAGSAIFVTSLDISVQSGTVEPVVSWGLAAQGNQVLSRGNYTAGGGISKNPTYPVSGSATGTALTFNILSGSGTVSYNVAYFVAVP